MDMENDEKVQNIGCFAFISFILTGLIFAPLINRLTIILFYGYEKYSEGLHLTGEKKNFLSDGTVLPFSAQTTRNLLCFITIPILTYVIYLAFNKSGKKNSEGKDNSGKQDKSATDFPDFH